LFGVAAHAQSPSIDPAFQPTQLRVVPFGSTTLAVGGVINDVVRQPDGKYIVGGEFQEINGVAAANIARLLPNGTPDATFAGGANGPVWALALQPDGKVLVGGTFSTLAGGSRLGIGRLQGNGTLDAAFAPPSGPISFTTVQVRRIALQPNGGVLITGNFDVQGTGTSQRFARLDPATGQNDASFQPAIAGTAGISALLVQPDGKILVGGSTPSYALGTLLTRLLPSGAVDNSFAVSTTYFISSVNDLALDQAGRIYMAGGDNSYGLRRYAADGTLQGLLGSGDPNMLFRVEAVAVQPNGYVLLSTGGMLRRIKPDGSFDTDFLAANGPQPTGAFANIRRILVQPDGAIMVAGAFTQVGTTPIMGVVRLNAANVLHVKPAAADARTAAWPIPAHDVLHLSLDAAARPQRVQLLDALGRTVRTLEQPTATFTLPTAGLAPGTYQVLVDYAEGGRVLRRVVLQ
jgi:uncharacterized delta-60 repeat protein